MDKLIIPPNSNWFAPSICYSTYDNGFIYGATSTITFIPPKNEKEEHEIKIFDLKKKILCFALCPDFKESNRIAVLNGDYHVFIYDFKTKELLKGHKGYENETGKYTSFSSITFTTENIVLSSLNSDVIKFCLLTNTYSTFSDFSNRNPITLMRTFPRNKEMVAAGTKNGLILLIDSEKMEIIARLRGHDQEITSFDFITFSVESKEEKEKIISSKKKEKEDNEDEDPFNIYEYDSVENEFGSYQGATTSTHNDCNNETPLKEKMHNTSDFNFLEECSNLKDQILSNETTNEENITAKFEDNEEQYGVKNDDNISVSLESNPSSHTPVLTEASLDFLDQCERMKDFNVNKDKNEITVLASGSREFVVWLWNVIDHSFMHKIKCHPKTKNSLLPSIFTNVLWLDQETLLITDNNGDIVEYKIKLAREKENITSQRQKKIFDVKGVLNLCKSDDCSVIWMSSIHRNICCMETKEFSKLVNLDTMQFRVHCIVENPFDSNLIAIGGNDKRLCLWNTSEIDNCFNSLKPYMNKIHSAVLCISWHPIKENILAFSTREGRIGVLDTNKSNNVPVILESFVSREIYSIKWTKFTNMSGSETVLLLACSSNGQLVYYTAKDYKINYVNQLKQVCSVDSYENLLVIGTNSGIVYICDINKEFEIIAEAKVGHKYIGMINWQDDKLAICTETDVAFIKDTKNVLTNADFEKSIIKLPHEKRVYSVRFNKAGDHIVTTCLNERIYVWNLETSSKVASYYIKTPAYCAIFMPGKENFIICGGQDSTVQVFEWKNYPIPHEEPIKSDEKKRITWGTLSELNIISKNKKRNIKKKPKNSNVSEVTDGIKSLKLTNKKNSSVFHAAHREITVDPVSYIEMLLNDDADRELSLNERIFGNRKDVKSLIDAQQYEPNAVNEVILPQITDDLLQNINERVSSKTLTEMHVAVAPSVSYEFWKKVCLAFGNQCIEKEEFIRAIPYLLAVNDVDNCIKSLCDSKYFREAWMIAKMRKDDSDPIFDNIMQQWIEYYDISGNYEAAAALLCIRKEFKRAHEFLAKRQNMDENLTKVFNMLSLKIEN
ncbi:hypothetical protein PVAND_009923 [Polypedilum vanderplanki]|uniref:Uncharacterized protein n=1 Tax=Polypedilum vanderplanki TaxID=319348 RepID=A0A9J6CER5_POLVA|nr:hypothetical protein PVAND_009923 [Polypedilum vanderplanki]